MIPTKNGKIPHGVTLAITIPRSVRVIAVQSAENTTSIVSVEKDSIGVNTRLATKVAAGFLMLNI